MDTGIDVESCPADENAAPALPKLNCAGCCKCRRYRTSGRSYARLGAGSHREAIRPVATAAAIGDGRRKRGCEVLACGHRPDAREIPIAKHVR